MITYSISKLHDCCHYTLHFASDLLEKSDLDLLTRELRPVQHKWESIGDELPYIYGVGNIRCQYSDDGYCLRKMLSTQLRGVTTWRNILDALRSPDVSDSQLSDELEAKYFPSEFINQYITVFQ